MVLIVDHMVGEVMDALHQNSLKENTLLVVSSDNGAKAVNFDGRDYGHKSNGNLRGQKGDIFEGGHREPCMMMWPEVITPGTATEELLLLVDIFATLVEIQDEEFSTVRPEDSRSFYLVLRGDSREQPVRDALVHHSLDGMYSLRTGPWKAIFGTGSGGFSDTRRYTPTDKDAVVQLYNIDDDHRKTNNLWNQSPEVVKDCRRILEEAGAVCTATDYLPYHSSDIRDMEHQ